MRPSLVALLCLLAALAGAGGVMFAAVSEGWSDSKTPVVLVRTTLSRSATQPVVLSKPVLARGFRPQQIFDERAAGVVTVYAHFGSGASAVVEQGSGFVVNRAGDILTAAHVIVLTHGASPLETPARTVYVQFDDGDRVAAQIVGWDPYDDVGLLKIDPRAHALDPVPLGNSGTVAVGQPVAAIGSPLGNAASLSVGVVSATGRAIPSLTTSYDLYDAIQTDAPIAEGNSGGPLLNAHGQVIGIAAQTETSLASGFEGIAFAVPVDSVKRSLEQLLSSGHVPYAYLGLETANLTPAIAKRFGYAARYGALVESVATNGPAAKAGIVAGRRSVEFEGQTLRVGGDVIVAIDGSPVVSSDAVGALVSERLVPGEAAWFTLVNGHHTRVVAVVLGTRPG